MSLDTILFLVIFAAIPAGVSLVILKAIAPDLVRAIRPVRMGLGPHLADASKVQLGPQPGRCLLITKPGRDPSQRALVAGDEVVVAIDGHLERLVARLRRGSGSKGIAEENARLARVEKDVVQGLELDHP